MQRPEMSVIGGGGGKYYWGIQVGQFTWDNVDFYVFMAFSVSHSTSTFKSHEFKTHSLIEILLAWPFFKFLQLFI